MNGVAMHEFDAARIERAAVQAGHIEECLDNQVEEARCYEIASWDMACEPSAGFLQ